MCRELLPKAKAWFQSLSIRAKIIAIYVPMLIVPTLLLGYISVNVYTRTIMEKTTKSMTDNAKMIVTRIDGLLLNTENCANMIAINLNRVFNSEANKTRDTSPNIKQLLRLELRNQILNQLSKALIIFPEVESATFINLEQEVFYTRANAQVNEIQKIDAEILRRIDQTGGINLWFPMQRRGGSTGDVVLFLGKNIIDINTGNKLGRLILTIREATFSAIYKSIGPSNNGGYFITDASGNIISSTDQACLLRPVDNSVLRRWVIKGRETTRVIKLKGRTFLVTKMLFPRLGWRLVGQIPIQDLVAGNYKIVIISILISIFYIIFALYGARLLSKYIAEPLIRLTDIMSRVNNNNLDEHFFIESKDEISILANGFNNMINRIKKLLIEVQYEQTKKREYELALMQAQIRPHFLYNTLEVIYALAELGRVAESQRITKALADFYRVALSKGKEIITIADEIKNVSSYLYIQRVRYADMFDFEINCSDQINECMIPKLTIQPLVENSIYHGLRPKGNPGKIKIEGYRDGEQIIIKVIDDGVGIPKEKLNGLLDRSFQRPPMISYGLISVNERIRLYFGEAYGLHITSEPGKGTTVTICLPILTEGGRADAQSHGG